MHIQLEGHLLNQQQLRIITPTSIQLLWLQLQPVYQQMILVLVKSMQIQHMVPIIHIIKPQFRVLSIIIRMPWTPLVIWPARQPVLNQRTTKMELKHTIGWKSDEIHQKQLVSLLKFHLNLMLMTRDFENFSWWDHDGTLKCVLHNGMHLIIIYPVWQI